MECKLKKDTVCNEEILWNNDSQIRIETEFSIPETNGAVSKLLCAFVKPVITSKSKAGESLLLDGFAAVKLIYIDDRDLIETFDTSAVFSKNLDLPFSLDDTIVNTVIFSEKQNVKALNERKINFSLEFCVKTTVKKQTQIEFISAQNDDCFEYKCEFATVCKNSVYGEKNIILDEEIELSEVHAPIGKILHYSYCVTTDDCKIMSNKTMLKGVITVSIVYLSDDEYKPCRFEHKIPFSQVCELDGIDEGFECSAKCEGVYIDLKCRSGGFDDRHTILLSGKVMLSVNAIRMQEVQLVSDMYCYEGELSLKENPLSVNQPCKNITDKFTAKKSLQFSEGSVGQVVFIHSDSVLNHSKIAEGQLTLYGTVYVKILMLNSSGIPEYYERGLDFEYNCKINEAGDNAVCIPNVKVCNTSFVIKSDSEIDVACELIVTGSVIKRKIYNVVTAADLTEGDTSLLSEYPLYICSLTEEEEIWNVAKKYKKRVGDIARRNGVDAECKTVCGKLII